MASKIIQSNIMELFDSFTKAEFKRFTSVINAEYFNTDPKISKLLACLKKYGVGKENYTEALQQKIFNTIFPEKKTKELPLKRNQVVLLNIKMSLLYKKAQQFLCIEELEGNPVFERELLHAALLKKGQYGLMRKELNKDGKVIMNTARKGTDFYNYIFKIEKNLLQYYYHNNVIVQKDNLQALSNILDLRYTLNKLSFELMARSLSRVFMGRNYELKTEEALSSLIEIPHCAENPLVQIYQHAIALMTSNDIKAYRKLLDLLHENSDIITKKILNDFYVVAVNFCTWKIRKGDLNYNQILFDLYKDLDGKDLLLESGHMPLNKLKNIVILACKVDEFDWAATIIEKYSTTLNKSFRASACHFNYGVVAFYQKKYDEAIHNFIRVGKINAAYDFNCRLLLLKSYYELDEDYDERTMRIFRREEQFIKKHKTLSSPQKKSGKNFIHILINLYRKRHKVGKKKLAGIRNKLEGFGYVDDKQWLLGKLTELGEMRKR